MKFKVTLFISICVSLFCFKAILFSKNSNTLFNDFRDAYFKYEKEQTCLNSKNLWCKYKDLLEPESPISAAKLNLNKLFEDFISSKIKEIIPELMKEQILVPQGDKTWATKKINLLPKEEYLNKLKTTFQDPKELCARKIETKEKCERVISKGTGESLKTRIEKSWNFLIKLPEETKKDLNDNAKLKQGFIDISDALDDFEKNLKQQKKFIFKDLKIKIDELLAEIIDELTREELEENIDKLEENLNNFFSKATEKQKSLITDYVENLIKSFKTNLKKIYPEEFKKKELLAIPIEKLRERATRNKIENAGSLLKEILIEKIIEAEKRPKKDKDKLQLDLIIDLFGEISSPGFWIENLPEINIKIESFFSMLPLRLKMENIKLEKVTIKNLFSLSKEQLEKIFTSEYLEQIKNIVDQLSDSKKIMNKLPASKSIWDSLTKDFSIELLKFMPTNWFNIFSEWVDKLPKEPLEIMLKKFLPADWLSGMKQLKMISTDKVAKFLPDNFIILLNIVKKLPIK